MLVAQLLLKIYILLLRQQILKLLLKKLYTFWVNKKMNEEQMFIKKNNKIKVLLYIACLNSSFVGAITVQENINILKTTNACPQCYLEGANLSGLTLQNANLQGAWLKNANFVSANSPANLQGAILEGANLKGADLTNANLIGATLLSANLSNANLTEATFSDQVSVGADLVGANLEGAKLG